MKTALPDFGAQAVRIIATSLLCLASASSGADALPPLNSEEMAAVVQEIRAMVKTDVNKVNDFVVREATPERIARLFNMPEFLQQPTVIRENGLIFAGQGTLLTFDRPSDVLNKISAWFPKEVAAARASKEQHFFTHLHLYGPFVNWNDEAAAFLGLWNCMPQVAWLKPQENPFMKRLSGGLPLLAIASRSSSEQEFDFGFCVRQRNGYRPGWTEAEHRANQEEIRRTGERVVPVLRKKFERFLTSSRCRGTGPDDCVLVLRLWASLSPDDAALARSIQTLEAEVAPDSPLPALQKPAADYGSGAGEGEARFDEALRKAAFLRAKLLSVLNAPAAWPSRALPATLHQMTLLQQKMLAAIDYRWRYYELDYYNTPVNPWAIVSEGMGQYPHLRDAVLAEIDALPEDAPCEVFESWFKYGGASLPTIYALKHWSDKPPLRCASPDWTWLRQGKSAEARDLRKRFLGLLGQGAMHDMLLANLTEDGNRCFNKKGAVEDWLRETCRTWISEPQNVPLKLQHSRLSLSKARQFRMTGAQPLPKLAEGDVGDEQGQWLLGLIPGMSAEAAQEVRAFADDLRRRNIHINDARIWSHPRHGTSLIELELRVNEDSHLVMAIGPRTLTTIEIPERFRGNGSEIVHVSDLDEDGRLEIWWAESFRQCQGDESDLERELDCTAKTADMGEIQGRVLSYFANTAGKAGGLLPAGAPAQAAIPLNEPEREEYPACNTLLLGTVLADKLALDFGGGDLNGGRGDVIGVVCKPHPLHPGQTLVALFHDLKEPQGEADENKKGFVFAVVDVARKKIHRLYRDTIEEDASTRIGDYSLRIDTARYNLAPGVRALGVRMNIGYSPRCAEGGESNYLTLFVEEGKRLKPILKNQPMSSWSIIEGSNNCGYGETDFTVDNVEFSLAVSDTSTQGWRDLDLVAHHRIEKVRAASDTPIEQQATKQAVGKFRANGKKLWLDTQPARARPTP